MATAAQVIQASLQKILVQAAEAPIEASEAQDFIFSMNNFMLDLDANGVTLGYTVVSNLGDSITIPTGALRGLIYNMAIEVAPEYGAQVTAAAAAIASEGLETMRKLGASLGASVMPATLPIGSGNQGHGSFRTARFFPDQEASILAETTGAISLETGTEEAAS